VKVHFLYLAVFRHINTRVAYVLYFVCLLYWLLAGFVFSLQFLKALFYLLVKFAHIFPSFLVLKWRSENFRQT